MFKKTPEFGVLLKGMSTASLGRSQLPESVGASAGRGVGSTFKLGGPLTSRALAW